MAYDKSTGSSLGYVKVFLGVLFLAILAIIAIIVWFGSDASNSTSESTVRNGTTGEIAQLGNNGFAAGTTPIQENTATQPTPTARTEPQVAAETTATLSEAPYTIDLPSGWAETDKQTTPNECGDDGETVVTTYVSGQETLKVYENGSPTGCDNTTIGDKYYDFDFTPDGSSITVNTSDTSAFCTKDENPTCPKGDGAVTVFVGNRDDSDVDTANSITGKTYFFSIVDTGLESDLQAQAAKLAKLAETITIN